MVISYCYVVACLLSGTINHKQKKVNESIFKLVGQVHFGGSSGWETCENVSTHPFSFSTVLI